MEVTPAPTRCHTAAAALFACVLFWVVGVSGGLAFLHRPTDPMAALLSLYGMLGAVIVSTIVVGGAASYIARTMPKRAAQRAFQASQIKIEGNGN